MKITKVRVLDFLGIKEAVIDKPGKMNKIKGRNGSGKTSILSAIKEAFKSSGVEPKLIRTGANKAEIFIEIDNRILVERKITPGNNQVTVVDDGQPINRAAEFLKSLLGKQAFNFDPTAFYLAKPKERRDILLSSIPFTLNKEILKGKIGEAGQVILRVLDRLNYDEHGLTVLAALKKDVYETRHVQGIEVTRLKKALEQEERDLPDTTEDWSKFNLPETLKLTQTMQARISEYKTDLQSLDALRNMAGEISDDIAQLEGRLARRRNDYAEVAVKGKELKAKIEAYQEPDIKALNEKIQGYNDHQKLIVKVDDIKRHREELVVENAKHQELENLYRYLADDLPKIILSEIKLPVENLEITDDDILVNGRSLDNLSTSEKIDFAVDMAQALAGKLDVICIDRYESLDPDAKRKFEAKAATTRFEYFMTEVSEGPLRVDCGDNPADGESASVAD